MVLERRDVRALSGDSRPETARVEEETHNATPQDTEMFPSIMSGDGLELSPKLKLWALLTGQRDGATPRELAREAWRWGIAVGHPEAIVHRVEELLRELEAAPSGSRRVARSTEGRYKALPRHGEKIIGPEEVPF